MDVGARPPFVRPDIMELWPRSFTARREALRITREWTLDHRMRVSGAMSSLLGTGMMRERAPGLGAEEGQP
jgi:hypothetical protein